MTIEKSFWAGPTIHVNRLTITDRKGCLEINQGGKIVSLQKSSGWGWFSWIFSGAVRIQTDQSTYYVKKSSFMRQGGSDVQSKSIEKIFPQTVKAGAGGAPKVVSSLGDQESVSDITGTGIPAGGESERHSKIKSSDQATQSAAKPEDSQQSDISGAGALAEVPSVPVSDIVHVHVTKRQKGEETYPYFIRVYADTKKAAEHGYVVDQSKVIKPNELSKGKRMQEETKLFGSPGPLPSKSRTFETVFEVQNMDSIDCALAMEGEDPCVLNLANAYGPGGGVDHGHTAQEEALFRRTNLFFSLKPDLNPHLKTQMDPYIMSKGHQGTYLIPPHGGIYTPGACVFRG